MKEIMKDAYTGKMNRIPNALVAMRYMSANADTKVSAIPINVLQEQTYVEALVVEPRADSIHLGSI